MAKGRPSRCPACGSTSSRSKGVRVQASGKKFKDRKCKKCGRRYLVKLK